MIVKLSNPYNIDFIAESTSYQVINNLDTSKSDTDYKDAAYSKKSLGVSKSKEAKIDPERARFPYCIVWTPLPLISWLLPFIGHTGIAMSDGVIHDFAGPYTITVDDLAFGETHK